MIGCGAILAIISGVSAPSTDSPRKMSAPTSAFERARGCVDRVRRLELVDTGSADVDHALAVAHDDIVVPHAHRLDQRGAGDCRRARAVDDDLGVAELALGEKARVEQAGGGDDRSAVLIVVHHRNLEPLLKRLLDDEALRSLDILEIYSAEARLHQRDCLDERVRVLGGELDVDRIDVGEALEQHRLAFHHRL
jgi:hypothetical protein